ncbi:MAG: hypothetical protein VX607_09315, partial [Planctomycetota bacterium]|nr:hypothetical protein [Planctomycetota bacterium]
MGDFSVQFLQSSRQPSHVIVGESMVKENELAPLARVQPNFYPTALQPNWISEGRLPVTPSLPRDFIDAKKR